MTDELLKGARPGLLMIALVVSVLLMPLAACGLWYEDNSIRYRLSVEVATPAGVRTGSGVMEVKVRKTPFWDLGRPVVYDFKGEAVAVDLPGGKTLFALLNRPDYPDEPIQRPFEAFASVMWRPEFLKDGVTPDKDKQLAYLRRAKPSVDLQGNARPLLVTFRDTGDPLSVEEVVSG